MSEPWKDFICDDIMLLTSDDWDVAGVTPGCRCCIQSSNDKFPTRLLKRYSHFHALALESRLTNSASYKIQTGN